MTKETGHIRYRGEVKSGTSANGNDWAFQDIVLEVPTGSNQYKNLLVSADIHTIADIEKITDNQEVEVTYYVSARQYKDRWFPEVKLWAISVVGEQQHTGGTRFEKKTYNAVGEAPKKEAKKEVNEETDLPF